MKGEQRTWTSTTKNMERTWTFTTKNMDIHHVYSSTHTRMLKLNHRHRQFEAYLLGIFQRVNIWDF